MRNTENRIDELEDNMRILQATTADLKLKVDGDGNGNPGLIRKHDRHDTKLNLIMLGVGIVVSLLITDFFTRRLINPPAQQTVTQTVGSGTGTVDTPSVWYTSEEVASIDRLTARTVRERAARGEYGDAAFKDPSGQWRFDKAAIDSRAQTSANARERARTAANAREDDTP